MNDRRMVVPTPFETLAVTEEGAVLFVEIGAPPMNLLAPELVRDLPVEDFRRDSALFLEGVRNPEVQGLFQTALKRGFQTRDSEMTLPRMLGDLARF